MKSTILDSIAPSAQDPSPSESFQVAPEEPPSPPYFGQDGEEVPLRSSAQQNKEDDFDAHDENVNPKLYPILVDLLKDKPLGTISPEEVEEACEEIFSPLVVQTGLKDLDDLGAITSKVNPETNEPELKLKDELDDISDTKLVPILEDLLKNKEDGKASEDEVK